MAVKTKSARATSAFTAKVPVTLKDQAKKDARKFNKTIDGIGEVVLRRFFELPEAMRAKAYESLPNKILGRPV